MPFVPGDYFVYCDMSGQKLLRSQCVKQWDGLIVKKEFADSRHPLDRQRPIPPEKTPKETRPEPEDTFLAYGDVTSDDL